MHGGWELLDMTTSHSFLIWDDSRMFYHFQAKLGNSWVSPNVGHLILKYLCPALQEVLQDGLKAHLLDLIIGQRKCQPWSLVEASTQLGEDSASACVVSCVSAA